MDEEIKELKSKLHEKELIADKTKEYLFVLENQYVRKSDDAHRFKKENIALKEEITSLKNEIDELKRENEDLKGQIKSASGGKASKPFDRFKKLF